MAHVTISYLKDGARSEFYPWRRLGTSGPPPDFEKILANPDKWETGPSFEIDLIGEEAAEEIFDLSNNPGRYNEWQNKTLGAPALSVGDLVEVDSEIYLCENIGWSLVGVNRG